MTPLTVAESWRLSHRDRPGAMPTREALERLRPATIVGVRAEVLLALVAECEGVRT